MAHMAKQHTTILQHLYGVVFLAGALLLVLAAFCLLIVLPIFALPGFVKHAWSGTLNQLPGAHSMALGLSIIAWISAIGISMQMGRMERRNRDFDKQFKVTIKPGNPHLDHVAANSRDVAEFIRSRVALRQTAFEFSEVIDEDYGAGFWAISGPSTFWVAASTTSDDLENPRGQFFVMVAFDPGLSVWKRLRHQPDPESFTQLLKAVKAAVKPLRDGGD